MLGKRKHSLSVTVITKNEEDRIARCLDSVKELADEIIVLDSGSTDRTVEVVRQYTSNVDVTDWPGYGIQKQRALERASGEWVLSIDADEALSAELQKEIAFILDSDCEEVAFRLPWAVIVFDKQLNHGRSARAPMRLFRRQGTRFTDAIVHEHAVVPPGKKGRTHGRLLHYTHRDFEHYLQKNRQYAWLGGKRRFAEGKSGGGLLGGTVRAILVFFQIYFLRGGFLDGSVGFLVAVMYSQGAFNKYAALWTLRRQESLEKKERSGSFRQNDDG